MKNKIFVLIAAILAVVGFFLAKNLNHTSHGVATRASSMTEDRFVKPHSPSFGNPLGRVTVVEWFDPECEACRLIHPIMTKIISEYKDRVQFIFRYMPYHGNSMYAAAALEEAKEFGQYEQALDLLFETQPEWGNHHQPQPELIPKFLATLNIPKEKLGKEYLLGKHGEKIRMDEADGNAVGVRGTPTFFVNGHMLQELGEEQLRAAIEAALQSGH